MSLNLSEEFLKHGYVYMRQLGSGAQGTVHLCEDAEGELVAIKLLHRNLLRNKHARAEVLNHSRLMHHNIVDFREVFTLGEHLCIAMEYCDKGNLYEALRRGPLSEGEARAYIQQLIYALDYCHRKGVTSRDVKLENILLKSEPGEGGSGPVVLLKLADFGYSKAREASAAKSLVGTPSYMAPEVLSTSLAICEYDASAADVWSAGVVLFVLLHGRYPFYTPSPGRGRPSSEEMRRAREGMLDRAALLRLFKPELTPECKGLLARMLEPEPPRRIKIPELMVHPWYGVAPADLPAFLACNDALLACSEEDYDRKQRASEVRAVVEGAAAQGPGLVGSAHLLRRGF